MLRYSPGTWHAVVSTSGVALFAPDVPLTTIEAVWEAIPKSGGGLAVVLEALVGTFGSSLSSLPAFAVVTEEGDAGEIRIAVRGPVQVATTAADGATETISGTGVSTWSEKVLTRPAVVELAAPGSSSAMVPVRDGIVFASSLRWVRADVARIADTVDAASAPVPIATVGLESAPRSPSVPLIPSRSPEQAASVPAGETVPVPPDETLLPDLADSAPTPEESMAEADDHTHGYDDLIFGETRMSTVEDAAVRATDASSGLISGPPLPPSGPSATFPSTLLDVGSGDHDGETISLARLVELQARLGVDAPMPRVSTPPARTCPVLIVSTGERYTLDRGAVIGRGPRAARAHGSMPHLIAVPSPNQDISRNHLELRVQGKDVVALDLDTTNGTLLLRVGVDPVRLQPDEPALLVAGDRLDLGDGVVLTFEGLS